MGGSLLSLTQPDWRGHDLTASVEPDLDLLVYSSAGLQMLAESCVAIDGGAVNLHKDVPFRQDPRIAPDDLALCPPKACPGGRATFGHLRDEHALINGQVELIGQFERYGGYAVPRHAYPRVPIAPILDQFGNDPAHRRERNGEAYVLRTCADGGVDPDELSLGVEQRPPELPGLIAASV